MHTNIVKLYTEDKLSIREINKITGMSTYKIRQTLISAGIQPRTKSEAQKVALTEGRSLHPTQGKTLDEKTKAAIGVAMVNFHNNKSDSQRTKEKKTKQKLWQSRDKKELDLMRDKGLDKTRNAAKSGSTLERFICMKLIEADIPFMFHHKSPFGSTNLEVDIMLKNRKTAIEVDGPSHFFPVWGEEKLKETKDFDFQKNGLLLGLGYTIIRVQHKKPGTRPSKTRMTAAWNCVHAHLTNNTTGLVEIEV